MLSAVRRRVSYANVVATFALVFAMTGGAYAAHKYIITSTKQISPKVLKGLRGKTGPQGLIGPQGPAGAPGTPGKEGAAGKEGPQGKEGVQGKEGKTGPQGPQGEEGSPWVAGGTLPSGQSEKGAWSAIYEAANVQAPDAAAISFTIPLAAAPKSSLFIGPEEGEGEAKEKLPAGCKGNFEHPVAEGGHLCVFSNETMLNATGWKAITSSIFVQPLGAGAGAQVVLASEEAGLVLADGTWAVTAE